MAETLDHESRTVQTKCLYCIAPQVHEIILPKSSRAMAQRSYTKKVSELATRAFRCDSAIKKRQLGHLHYRRILNQLLLLAQAQSEPKEGNNEEAAPRIATDEPKAVEDVPAVEEAPEQAAPAEEAHTTHIHTHTHRRASEWYHLTKEQTVMAAESGTHPEAWEWRSCGFSQLCIAWGFIANAMHLQDLLGNWHANAPGVYSEPYS